MTHEGRGEVFDRTNITRTRRLQTFPPPFLATDIRIALDAATVLHNKDTTVRGHADESTLMRAERKTSFQFRHCPVGRLQIHTTVATWLLLVANVTSELSTHSWRAFVATVYRSATPACFAGDDITRCWLIKQKEESRRKIKIVKRDRNIWKSRDVVTLDAA